MRSKGFTRERNICMISAGAIAHEACLHRHTPAITHVSGKQMFLPVLPLHTHTHTHCAISVSSGETVSDNRVHVTWGVSHP